MFDAEDTSTERLRAAEAWDVGLLVLHIGALSVSCQLVIQVPDVVRSNNLLHILMLCLHVCFQ